MPFELRDKTRIQNDPEIANFVRMLDEGDHDSGFLAVGVYKLMDYIKIPGLLSDGTNPTVPGAIEDIRIMFQDDTLLDNLKNPHYSRGIDMTSGAIEAAKMTNIARRIGQSAVSYTELKKFCAEKANAFEIQKTDRLAAQTLKQIFHVDLQNIFYPTTLVRQQFGFVEDGHAQAVAGEANLNLAPLEVQLDAINRIEDDNDTHIHSRKMKMHQPICPTAHDFNLIQFLLERRIAFLDDIVNDINQQIDAADNLWQTVTHNFLLALRKSDECGVYKVLTMYSSKLESLVEAMDIGEPQEDFDLDEDCFFQAFKSLSGDGAELDARVAAFDELFAVLMLTTPSFVMGAIRNHASFTNGFQFQMDNNTHCTFGDTNTGTLAQKLQQHYRINMESQFPLSPKVYRRSAEIFRTIVEELPVDNQERLLPDHGWQSLKLTEFSILKCNNWNAIRCKVAEARMADLLERQLHDYVAADEHVQEDYLAKLMQTELVDDLLPGFFQNVSDFVRAEMKMIIDVRSQIQTLYNNVYLIQREPCFAQDHVQLSFVNPEQERGNFKSGILYAACIGERGEQFPNKVCLVLLDSHGHHVERFNFFRFPDVARYFDALFNHNHETTEDQLIRDINGVQDARNMLLEFNVQRLIIVFGGPWAACVEKLVVNIIGLPDQVVLVQNIEYPPLNVPENIPADNILRLAKVYQDYIHGLSHVVDGLYRMQIDWISKLFIATLALHPFFHVEQEGATDVERFLLSSTLAAICFTTCPIAASVLLSSTILEEDGREVHLCDYLCDPPSNMYVDQAEMRLMRSVVNVFCGNRMTWGLKKLAEVPLMAPVLSLLGNFSQKAIMTHMDKAIEKITQSLFPSQEHQVAVQDFRTYLSKPRDGQDGQDNQTHPDNRANLLHFLRNSPELTTDIKALACNESGFGGLTQGSLDNIQVELQYLREDQRPEDRFQLKAPIIVKWMALVKMSHQQIREILELMINSTDSVQLNNFFAIAQERHSSSTRRMVCMLVLDKVKTARMIDFTNFFNHNRRWFEGRELKKDELWNQLECNSSSFTPLELTQEAGSSPYSKAHFRALKCYGKHVLPQNKYEVSAMWPYYGPFSDIYKDIFARKFPNGIRQVQHMTMKDAALTVVFHTLALLLMKQRRLYYDHVQHFTGQIEHRKIHSIVECLAGEYMETVDNGSNLHLMDPLEPYKPVGPKGKGANLKQKVTYLCKLWRARDKEQDGSTLVTRDIIDTDPSQARLTVGGIFTDVGAIVHLDRS